MHRSNVLLPAPFWPTIPNASPFCTWKEPLQASTSCVSLCRNVANDRRKVGRRST